MTAITNRTRNIGRKLAAAAAVLMLPAMAAAQTPDAPVAKPAAQEQRAGRQAARPERAERDHAKGRLNVADLRVDRGRHHQRDGGREQREDRRERRG